VPEYGGCDKDVTPFFRHKRFLRIAAAVAGALQPAPPRDASHAVRQRSVTAKGAEMSHVISDGRLLGFDLGDWSILLGGSVLACFSLLLL
jgi:hypothetical protein